MNKQVFQRPTRGLPAGIGARLRAWSIAATVLLAAVRVTALPTVTTVSGGPATGNTKFFGYADGNTATVAQFHTPSGIALDATGNFLVVADRDNNAVRLLDFGQGLTGTFATNGLNKPVAVAVDGDNDVYVLNQGSGSDGNVLEFDSFGELIATYADNLVNASGLTLDDAANVYVTVNGNTIIGIPQDAPGTVFTLATITNAGANLQGLVVLDSGVLAVCDAGRNGILLVNPTDGTTTNLTGFNGPGDTFGHRKFAKFFQPTGITKAGGGVLIVTDFGNNRVKVVDSFGTVTNLYGVSSNYWVQGSAKNGIFPGWYDGTVCSADMLGCVEARLPVGVAYAADGTIYTTEIYYDLIRKVTNANLPPPPPPPPPVPQPAIGWVDFPPPTFASVLRTDQPFIFNNDVIIAIEGTAGTETHYTFGATPQGLDTIPDPSATVGITPPGYRDGLFTNQVAPTLVPAMPDLTIKAIGTAPGRVSSGIAVARFVFKAANPLIVGANAASFTVTDLTSGASLWYTTDGSDPTNGLPSIGPISSGATLSLDGSSNFTFKVRAFRDSYQPSDVTLINFATNSFVPNSITLGFASGEASSDFVASPGQFFYAPVTLSIVPGTKIYSLQFNVAVTNGPSSPPVAPGAVGFQSFLEKPLPDGSAFVTIPTAEFLEGIVSTNPPTPPPGFTVFSYNNSWFQDLTFVNSSLNLIGVGWLERATRTNLYNTLQQDLIALSQPHDTVFHEIDLRIVPGGYAFGVPPTAVAGNTYRIQIGRPSATSDGIGAPGSSVVIATPTNGAVSSIKTVTIGQRKYVAGDSAPFRWFNAGDFGDTNLDNSDVEQVFQSAIYGYNPPPAGSDFFDGMDSAGATYVDLGKGYLEFGSLVTDTNAIANFYNGDDTSINQIGFGDGKLDVTDVYVTFRRSLDPSLVWFRRFWTNGVRAAEITANITKSKIVKRPATSKGLTPNLVLPGNSPSVNFTAGDLQVTAGQTVQIPITAQILGGYPLRVLMLNLSVNPLDGSPALTSPIQFNVNPALGAPTLNNSVGDGNYAAAWLDSSITGLSSNALLGMLVVTIPANAGSTAAYSITFDHASASPNGIVAFAPHKHTGLLTLSNRSASSFNDGIPDSWRLRYFGTVYNLLSMAAADADGDGMSNGQEYIAGTDPTDPLSLLKAAAASGATSQTRAVRWPSVLGKNYVIQRSSNLFGNWTSLSTNTGTGGQMEYDDVPAGSAQFYRVQVLP